MKMYLEKLALNDCLVITASVVILQPGQHYGAILVFSLWEGIRPQRFRETGGRQERGERIGTQLICEDY